MVEKAFNWEFLVHFISFDEVYHFSSILWNKKICMCFISIQTLNNNSWNLHWLLFSHVQLFVTPWTAAHQASLFFTISLSLLKFISIESMMPFNHLILCHPLLLLPTIILCITKYWSFHFTTSPCNKYSGLIFFKIDWFYLVFQGTLKSLLQYHSLKASILQC